MNHYEILGVSYDADQRAIKRAYAALIKEFRPDSHPQEFARIRSAYEVLLERCRYREQLERYDDVPDTADNQPSTNASTELHQPESENNDQHFNQLLEQPIVSLAETDTNKVLSVDTYDSFNQLITEKPIIELSEPEPSNANPVSDDRFSRLVDKPIITGLNDSVSDIEEQQWLKVPSIDVSALIQQLSEYQQPAQEQATLACFQNQLAMVKQMNLDQRMEYEEKLYNKLLYTNCPPLLVFAAASDYFAWKDHTSWIKTAQTKWAQKQFETLSQLAKLYQQVCQRYNPYFQAKHDANIKPPLLTTHYHYQLAQEQREDWFVACQSAPANLTELHHYFAEQPQRQPVYVIDVLFGSIIGYLTALLNYRNLTDQQQIYWFWLMSAMVCFSGVLLALLLLGWRRLTAKGRKVVLVLWFLSPFLFLRIFEPHEDMYEQIFVGLTLGLLMLPYLWIITRLYDCLVTVETFIARQADRFLFWMKNRQSSPDTITLSTPLYNSAHQSMNKQIYPLLFAQFLSAFADNAILFTVIAMVMHAQNQASWYIPALQSAFFVAYVIFAPWVGSFADHHAKARVLMNANLIKAFGAGLLFFGIEPLLAYAVVGLGAAIYSPAKYGILPELVGHEALVKANGWVESSTILAILLGMKIGAMLADYSIHWALAVNVLLFIISALATLSLPVNISKKMPEQNVVIEFIEQIKAFFTTPRSRFAVLGGSLFWATAASLRVILIVWAPLVLLSKNASEIADLTLFLTVGIIAGSLIVPWLIPMEQLRRVRIAAYIMAVLIVGLSLTTHVLSAQLVLLVIGAMGGIFVVPINAVLQEQGQQTIGSGSAVALQNFFQNAAMLLAVGIYTIASAQQVDPVSAMSGLGILVFIATFAIALCLPKPQTT